MALTKAEKSEIFEKYGKHEGDTGSTEVQIVMFHKRVVTLQDHLREHKHDESTRRGLLKLVGKRRRLLGYLRKGNPERYKELIKELGLRR